MTRCKLHQMTHSHRNRDKFPYTAEDLARYMHYIISKMSPVIDEEYHSVSSEEVIDLQ